MNSETVGINHGMMGTTSGLSENGLYATQTTNV